MDATAAIASNILDKSVRNENSTGGANFTSDEAKVAAARVVTLVHGLAGLASRRATVGGQPVKVSTPAFQIAAAKNTVETMEGVDAGVQIPIDAFVRADRHPMMPSDIVTSRVVDWSEDANPFFYAEASARTNHSSDPLLIGSAVKSVDLFNDANENIVVQGLVEPVRIHLHSSTNASNNTRIYCAYWDTEQLEWVVDDDTGYGNFSTTGSGAVCEYRHLTDFVALLGPTPQLNKPCSSLKCWSKLWLNPVGIALTAVCAFLVCATWSASCRRYVAVQSNMDHESFHASSFAMERKKVLVPDAVVPTSCWQDTKHKFSHDYVFGGLLRPLTGDPLDRLQRTMIVLTTVLVTMCVNLLLLPPSVTQESSCNETHTGTIECSGEQVEPGVLNAIITAGITTPLVSMLVAFFKHLRKPLMQSVEPPLSLGLGEVIFVVVKELCCKCRLCKRNGGTDTVHEQTLTDQTHEQWRVSSRTASATHWRSVSFFRAYVYAALLSVAALFFIASFVSNMSAENTKAWTISIVGATATKLFLMNPFKIILTSGVLRCAKAWPVTARVLEEHIATKGKTSTESNVTLSFLQET